MNHIGEANFPSWDKPHINWEMNLRPDCGKPLRGSKSILRNGRSRQSGASSNFAMQSHPVGRPKIVKSSLLTRHDRDRTICLSIRRGQSHFIPTARCSRQSTIRSLSSTRLPPQRECVEQTVRLRLGRHLNRRASRAYFQKEKKRGRQQSIIRWQAAGWEPVLRLWLSHYQSLSRADRADYDRAHSAPSAWQFLSSICANMAIGEADPASWRRGRIGAPSAS